MLLALIVLLFLAGLVGVFIGRGSPAEADPIAPCEFEEGQDFCVDEQGDVNYNTDEFRPVMIFEDGVDYGSCTSKFIGSGG